MIILCGMTSSGKDTIKKELINDGMKNIVTYTTRPMRQGEIDGTTYHFISTEKFHELESKNFFVETAFYDVATNERWFYGSSYEELNTNSLDKVVILNPYGIKTLFEKLSSEELSTWFVVYLYCNEEIIKKRLAHRGDNPKEAERRIETDKRDFCDIEKFVNMKVCNDGSNKPEVLAKIIRDTYDRFLIEG